MANYKKVVEMLGENLASFLELSKKLLVDWSVEPKKLLHFMQNIRKDELLGLIAGTHEIKEKLVKKQVAVEPTEKFALLVDLGTIIVPDGYIHSKCLENFTNNNREKFYGFNDNITDKNFPNPTRVLKPGDKLRIKAFKQIVPGTTTSEERMAFLSTQKAIHTGAQGLALVFEQKRDLLQKGYWYSSFDKKEDEKGKSRLWVASVGSHRVPDLYVNSGGDFYFDLGYFEFDWDDDYAFLCFCDEEFLDT